MIEICFRIFVTSASVCAHIYAKSVRFARFRPSYIVGTFAVGTWS